MMMNKPEKIAPECFLVTLLFLGEDFPLRFSSFFIMLFVQLNSEFNFLEKQPFNIRFLVRLLSFSIAPCCYMEVSIAQQINLLC